MYKIRGSFFSKPLRKGLKSFVGLCLLTTVVSCQQTVNPPEFTGMNEKSDYESCKDARFKLEEQTPQSFRSLMTCVNGAGKTIQPYVDLLATFSDEELQVVITGFEKQFRPYLNQSLDLLHRMTSRGLLRDLALNVSVLAETGQLKSVVETLRTAYLQGETYSDPNMVQLQKSVVELIERDELKPALIALAKLYDSPPSWQGAAYMSRSLPDEKLTSKYFLKWLSGIVPQVEQQNTLDTLFQLASDSATIEAAGSYSEEEMQGMAYFLQVLWGEGLGEVHIPQIQKLFRGLNKELQCYERSGKSFYFQNALSIDAQESARRRGNKQSLDRFYGVEVPFIFSSTLRDCNVPPDILRTYSSVINMVAKGASVGMSAVKVPFTAPGRINSLSEFILSPLFGDYQNIQKMSTLRRIDLPLFKSYVGLSDADKKSLARLLSFLSTPDVKGDAVITWANTNLNNDLAARAKIIFASLAVPRNTLYDLLLATAGKDLELEYTLRLKIASSASVKSVRPIMDVVSKLVSKNPDTVRSLVESYTQMLSNQKGGWGAIFSILAESSELAEEKPIQNWMKVLLSDEKYFEQLRAVLFKASQKPEFTKAMEFTSGFALSTDFEGFLKFMMEIFVYSGEKGLATQPNPNGYRRPTARQYQWADAQPLVSAAPSFEIESCKKVTGSIFERGSTDFLNVLKCVSTEADDKGLGRIAEMLERTGHLAVFQDLFSRRVFGEQQIHNFLIDMERWQSSGDLTKFYELVATIINPQHGLVQILDPVLYKVLSNAAPESFEGFGKLLLNPQTTTAMTGLFDAISQDQAKPFFSSQDNFQMPVENSQELVRQGLARVPNVGEATVRSELQKYIERSDAYFYDHQLFKPASEQAMREDFWRILFQLLRTNPEEKTGDLEEILYALRDLAEWDRTGQVDVAGFIRWGVTQVKPVPYYVGESDHPSVRFVSPFDQLDILVANADMSVLAWLPIVGADHMGTHFQIEVAKSRNLNETLASLRGELKLGIAARGLGLISQKQFNHLRNGSESFDVLEEAHKRNYLVILQRIYQALMRATPPKYKTKQDPVLNHLSLIHQPTRWAMFSKLVSAFRSVEAQGQLTHYVKALLQLVRTIPPSDNGVVRAAFTRMLTRDPGQISQMDALIGHIFALPVQDGSFKNFKDFLYHMAFAWPRTLGRSYGLFEITKDVDLQTMLALLEELNKDLKKGASSESFKTITQLANLETESARALRVVTTQMMEPQAFGKSYFYTMSSPWLNFYENDRAQYNAFMDALKAVLNSGQLNKKETLQLVKRLLTQYSVVRDVLGGALSDRQDRENIRLAILELLRQNGTKELLESFTVSYKSGEIQDLLTLINKYRRSSR
ncbi:MAG: hypothetical protein AB7F59_00570 [Bdellovibrionales bacterium]